LSFYVLPGRFSQAAQVLCVFPTTLIQVIASPWPTLLEQSWRSQTVLETKTANTIADGIAVRVPIPEAVSDMQGIVDDVLLVDDDSIVGAMRLCLAHAGLLLEPAGAVGLAGIAAHREKFRGLQVATVLCGSNLTAEQIHEYFDIRGTRSAAAK
jgi:threonine dehydratase